MEDAAGAGIGIFGTIIYLGLIIFIVAAQWKIFEKAGKPGWASLIPIYSAIVLLEIIEKPMIWLLYYIIPFVNFYFLIMTVVELAKKFGKDTGFAVGMIFLPIVFYPMLAFGDAQYQGSGGKTYDDNVLDRG